MKRIIIFVSDGFEEIEALSVVDILRRAQVEVHLCSVTGKNIVTGSHKISVVSDKSKHEVNVMDYDGCVLPGGMPGAENLSNDSFVKEFFVKMNDMGKLCCAICAAPMALYKYGLLKGRTAVSYPGFLDYEDVLHGKGNVVKDCNIITATGPAAACDFAFAILKDIGLEEEARRIREGMLFE